MENSFNEEDDLSSYIPGNIKPLNEKENSGFFDLPIKRQCFHPGHNPPSHICIPPGKGYRHVCPKCGQVTVITPQQVY